MAVHAAAVSGLLLHGAVRVSVYDRVKRYSLVSCLSPSQSFAEQMKIFLPLAADTWRAP